MLDFGSLFAGMYVGVCFTVVVFAWASRDNTEVVTPRPAETPPAPRIEELFHADPVAYRTN